MRSSPEASDNVKRFSYQRSNSNTCDDQNGYKKSSSPVDDASKSILGSSDMDVIWSVRKDGNPVFKDKLGAFSPPPMKSFYSRYTSQDPRFKSLLDSHEKDSGFGQRGGLNQYSYSSQNKSNYSYSQERGKQQRKSEPSTTTYKGYNYQPTSQVATQNDTKRGSHQDVRDAGKNPHSDHNAGNFDNPSSASQKDRRSSNSWDDFD